MANIVGEEIPKYTTDQIRVRQNLHGKGSPLSGLRNASEISLLNSNTSWVKLASGVSVTQDKLKSLNLNSSEYVGMGLAKSHVLFGGVSTLSGDSTNQWLYPKQFNTGLSGYSHSTDFGIVPMPGIIDVSIKTLNRGSIKKASVKLKAYSREQFEILDVLYLRLGFTVLLEWGNVNYLDNDGVNYRTVGGTLIEDSKRFFNPAFTENKSYLDLLGPIEYYRKKYQGNYDGFLGKISNFSWSFNEDGSYDISLEIISLGDVIESLKSNVSIDSKLNTYIEQFRTDENSIPEGEPSENSFLTPYENNNIITSMLWLWKFLNIKNSGETNNGVSITTGNGVRGFIGRILDLTNTELQVYKILLVEKGNNSNIIFEFPERPYISDDEIQKNVDQIRAYLINKNLQDALNDSYTIIDYVFRVADEEEIDIVYERYTALEVDTLFTSTNLPPIPVIRLNTPEKDHYIRFEYLLQYIKEKVLPNVKTNGASNPPIFNIEYGRYSNKMYSLPNQISLDPRICLVRNDKFFKSGSPDIPAKVLSELIPFRAVDYNSNASPNTAYPMNIYLNFNFVVDSLNSNTDERGDVGLFGFLSSICDGLNKALGGINNLEPIIDESSNTLKIIDSTPIPGLTKDKGNYTLEVFGYNEKQSNFIRKIDLQTAITPEYATMVTVGATAGGYVKGVEATAFSNWNKGLIDRFKTEFTTANTKEEEGEVVDEAEKNYVEQFLSKFINCYGFAAPNGWSNGRVQIKFVDDIIGSNLSVGTEYFKYLQNKNKAGGAIGFIPFKFSFVMDGLAGFKIYNKLHISTRFLPRNYGDTLDFIITGITHDLKDNNWETSIQTQVIPKTTEISDLEISEEYIKQTIADVNLTSAPLLPSPTSIGSGDKIRVDADLTTPWFKSPVDGRAQGAYRYLQLITQNPLTGNGTYYKIPGTSAFITSGFGQRDVSSSTHQAIDIAAGGKLPQTCPFQKGKIIQQIPNTYGIIKIQELNPTTNKPTGRYARFLHSNYFGFKEGDIVKFNDIVGKEGGAGKNNPKAYGIHSHFELTLTSNSSKVTVDNKRAVKYPSENLPGWFIAPTIEEIKCAHGLSNTPLPLPEVSTKNGVTNYKCIF